MSTKITPAQIVTFTQQEGRWYPLLDGNTIDMRSPGFRSKAEAKAWAKDRSEMTGEKIAVQFR